MKKLLLAIATVLSGIVLFTFEIIWDKAINLEWISETGIGKLLAKQVTVLEMLVFVALLATFYFMGFLFHKRIKTRHLRKQKALMKYKRLDMLQKGIMYRWQVCFDDNNEPFIENLQAFCTKHKPPVRLFDNVCPAEGCENNKTELDAERTRHVIESNLVNRWEQLNKL